MTLEKSSKRKKLLLGILFDFIGMISYVFPLFDIVWAPLAAYLMTRLYPGKAGKIAAIVAFIEEALPMTDIIPSFTIMWFYTFVFSRKKADFPTGLN
ncbi:MAG: hypothetical protein ABI295_05450 [Xanthomarina sp.]